MSNQGERRRSDTPYDVNYGLSTQSVTTGDNVVIAVKAAYHGCTIIAATTNAAVTMYDNATTASGNMLDTFIVGSGKNMYIDKFIPIQAKNGIVAVITGVGAYGTVFYSPSV